MRFLSRYIGLCAFALAAVSVRRGPGLSDPALHRQDPSARCSNSPAPAARTAAHPRSRTRTLLSPGTLKNIDAIGNRNVGCNKGMGNWYSLDKQVAMGRAVLAAGRAWRQAGHRSGGYRVRQSHRPEPGAQLGLQGAVHHQGDRHRRDQCLRASRRIFLRELRPDSRCRQRSRTGRRDGARDRATSPPATSPASRPAATSSTWPAFR